MRIDSIKLQILMGQRDLSFSMLATASNVSRQTISCIKAGKTCSPVVACKLAKALSVQVEELLKNE